MRKSLLSIVAAASLVATAGVASAQTTTTTTTTTEWTPDQRTAITQYSTTQHYQSYSDPNFTPSVGAPLPSSVTVYPLPNTVRIERPERYSYGIVNNQPIIIERSNRQVVHAW